jgi:hypothetical protein
MGGCDLHEAFHGLSKNIFQKRLTFLSSGLILIKYMKKTTTIIWIACVIFLVAITTKTMAHDSFNDKVNNWVAKEKEKTIQFQKESWAESKEQLGRTWNSIKNLFQKKAQ